jgi:hypothetical protein
MWFLGCTKWTSHDFRTLFKRLSRTGSLAYMASRKLCVTYKGWTQCLGASSGAMLYGNITNLCGDAGWYRLLMIEYDNIHIYIYIYIYNTYIIILYHPQEMGICYGISPTIWDLGLSEDGVQPQNCALNGENEVPDFPSNASVTEGETPCGVDWIRLMFLCCWEIA